jgi:hypothetical protein
MGALLQAPAVAGDQVDPTDPPQGLFADEWMSLSLAGQRAGYSHITTSRDGDRITTRALMHLSLARAGVPMEVSTMESSTETLDGRPLRFESSQKMATATTVIRGRVHDGRVALETSQYGMTQSKSVPYPAGALMAWGMFREQVQRGMTEGLSYELDMYAPAMRTDQGIKMSVVVGGRETIDLEGKQVEATRVTQTMHAPVMLLETVGWVADDWTMLKAEMQVAGMPIKMVRCDKQTAMQDVEPPEFFVNTLVKPDKLVDRDAARRIRYQLRLAAEGEAMPDLPETGMQKPRRLPDGAVELDVTRQDHQALGRATPAPPTDEMAEYLEGNLWINCDDPEVTAMAAEAAGNAKGPYQIADRLRKYVTEVIRAKNLNVGFASASEVCRNKVGDCSEHAVLLAALGRVHKIPSRVVMGLVYVPHFGTEVGVFGFHMWTQFHIGGRWVDFDAAQRESDCNPTHLAISVSSLKDAALGDMAFALLSVIGGLEIEMLEADPPGVLSER